MTYRSRITADPAYIQALGQAVYDFTYLEWVVIWTIVKLSPDGFESIPKGATAGKIASALEKAIGGASPPLPNNLRGALVKFSESYRYALRIRNKLLHAHPYTASDGLPRLLAGDHDWSVEKVKAAAKLFDDAASMGNAIFHGDLAEARP